MLLADLHDRHGATYATRGGREVVAHYGRPERVHSAVRRGVGLIHHAYGVLTVAGEDRVEFVDNAVSNRVPRTEGEGAYALLLDPSGRVETDMYVFDAGERLLLFTPPGEAGALADQWREKTFIQDVEIDVATEAFGVFGVHGPNATEKIASVFSEGTPEEALTFVRGSIGEAGVTVVRTDAPAGEEGYDVVCGAAAAPDVFDTLETRGLNAVPFGYRTWDSLTLEAGTPLFETELEGRLANSLGLGNAVDFEKGCFVGQETVARIENRGRPPERLLGLAADRAPDGGDVVRDGGEAVGTVTRGRDSPTRGEPLAFAFVDAAAEVTGVDADGETVPARRVDLPLVDGSQRSARLPR
jgi:aminomethyltransferase